MVDGQSNFAKPLQTCHNESEPSDTDRKTKIQDLQAIATHSYADTRGAKPLIHLD